MCVSLYVAGDRSAIITVSAASGVVANGLPQNLVNGVTGPQGSTDNIAFGPLTLDATKWVQFDFGASASVVVTGVKWYGEAKSDGTPAPQGTWQWAGSNDMVTWTNIGAAFALAGLGLLSAQTIDLSSNATGYRAYRMIGVSGQTDATRWQGEVEFKQCQETCRRPLAIFLFSGQSNSEGQAPNPDQSVYSNRSRVYNFALDGTWKPAADPLMDTAGSLWPVLNNTNGPATSPALSFADTMAAQLKNFDIGVVVSAHGSTTIDQWSFSTDPATLCGAAMDRAQKALFSAPDGSFIAGFIWQQGESDTLSEASALAWKPKLDALVSNIRSYLSADLPVEVIGLGPNPGGSFPAWSVLSGIEQFMSVQAPFAFVYSADLPNTAGNADWLNTSSVLTIGQRAANKMRPLLPPML